MTRYSLGHHNFVGSEGPELAGVGCSGRGGAADDVSEIILLEPPTPIAEYPALVPQVNADGNDIDGLRSVTLQVPLGTYTGWNVRRSRWPTR